MKIAKTVKTIADMLEGLEAHGNTVRVRMRDKRR